MKPTEDLPLWRAPMVRTTDPQTCSDAAAKVQPKAATGRALVLECLKTYGNQTDFELATRTGWRQVSIGKRRGELRDLGLVRDTGITRDNEFGNPCIVWGLV